MIINIIYSERLKENMLKILEDVLFKLTFSSLLLVFSLKCLSVLYRVYLF